MTNFSKIHSKFQPFKALLTLAALTLALSVASGLTDPGGRRPLSKLKLPELGTWPGGRRVSFVEDWQLEPLFNLSERIDDARGLASHFRVSFKFHDSHFNIYLKSMEDEVSEMPVEYANENGTTIEFPEVNMFRAAHMYVNGVKTRMSVVGRHIADGHMDLNLFDMKRETELEIRSPPSSHRLPLNLKRQAQRTLRAHKKSLATHPLAISATNVNWKFPQDFPNWNPDNTISSTFSDYYPEKSGRFTFIDMDMGYSHFALLKCVGGHMDNDRWWHTGGWNQGGCGLLEDECFDNCESKVPWHVAYSTLAHINNVFENQLRITHVMRRLTIQTSWSTFGTYKWNADAGNSVNTAFDGTSGQLRSDYGGYLQNYVQIPDSVGIGLLLTASRLEDSSLNAYGNAKAALDGACSSTKSNRATIAIMSWKNYWIYVVHEVGHMWGMLHNFQDPTLNCGDVRSGSSSTCLSLSSYDGGARYFQPYDEDEFSDSSTFRRFAGQTGYSFTSGCLRRVDGVADKLNCGYTGTATYQGYRRDQYYLSWTTTRTHGNGGAMIAYERDLALTAGVWKTMYAFQLSGTGYYRITAIVHPYYYSAAPTDTYKFRIRYLPGTQSEHVLYSTQAWDVESRPLDFYDSGVFYRGGVTMELQAYCSTSQTVAIRSVRVLKVDTDGAALSFYAGSFHMFLFFRDAVVDRNADLTTHGGAAFPRLTHPEAASVLDVPRDVDCAFYHEGYDYSFFKGKYIYKIKHGLNYGLVSGYPKLITSEFTANSQGNNVPFSPNACTFIPLYYDNTRIFFRGTEYYYVAKTNAVWDGGSPGYPRSYNGVNFLNGLPLNMDAIVRDHLAATATTQTFYAFKATQVYKMVWTSNGGESKVVTGPFAYGGTSPYFTGISPDFFNKKKCGFDSWYPGGNTPEEYGNCQPCDDGKHLLQIGASTNTCA